MKYYEFINIVKIVSEYGALNKLPQILKESGVRAPILISDPVLAKIGTTDKIKKILKEAGISLKAEFYDVPRDSAIETVNSLEDIYQINHCDGIVAIGGGSVLDTAKGLKLLIGSHAQDLNDLMGIECVKKFEEIPFIAIPTTAGTGSEVTRVCVISDHKRGMKMEFISREMLPSVCILDGELLATLPARAMVTGAFDALCHAIEAFSGLQKNILSDRFAKKAVGMIIDALPRGLQKEKDALQDLITASNMAGISFSNSMVGIVHAMGHSLGAVCSLPHDLSIALLLPECIRFNAPYENRNYAQLLSVLEPDAYEKHAFSALGEAFAEKIHALYLQYAEQYQLPLSLSAAGVQKSDFEAIARLSMDDGALLSNTRPVMVEDVFEILEKSY